MMRLRVLIERGEVCHCLCAKTMFYESMVEPSESEPRSAEGPFWCGQTQSLFGPDGEHADMSLCRPGRGCCATTAAL